MSTASEEVGLGGANSPPNEWRIGFILVRSGRLKKDDVPRVIQMQRQNGLRFGDAAIALGVIGEGDVRFALAHQFDYPYVTHDDSKLSRQLVAAYQPASSEAEQLRGLRSQLILRWFDVNDARRRAIAIAGPDRHIGRSRLAANLAVTFSQLGKKTVLIDGDLRRSTQHELFGLSNRHGLSEVLSGRIVLSAAVQRTQALPNLAVLTAGAKPPNPQEMLSRGGFATLMDSLRGSADVVIVDTPAYSETSDSQIIAKTTIGALVMAKKGLSRANMLLGCVGGLKAAGADLLLSVLVT
jgi:chain length determinant protein tyrosine kinase EpsG